MGERIAVIESREDHNHTCPGVGIDMCVAIHDGTTWGMYRAALRFCFFHRPDLMADEPFPLGDGSLVFPLIRRCDGPWIPEFGPKIPFLYVIVSENTVGACRDW